MDGVITHQQPYANVNQASVKQVPAANFTGVLAKWSWIVLLIAAFVQVLIFTTLPNVVAVASVLLAWQIVKRIFLKKEMLEAFPLSSFLIIGYASTQFYFPIIFTLIEGKPLVFNLDLPYDVFLHSTVTIVVLALAHYVYRSLPYKHGTQSNSWLVKAGLFNIPSDLQLWIMGFMGIGATFYVYLYTPDIGWEVTGSASDKAIQALMPFSYIPFFIPFGEMYGKDKPVGKSTVLLLIGYTLLLFLVSIGRNSRGGFMIGFTTLGFSYIMGLMLGKYKNKIFTVKNAMIAVFAGWLLTGPVADIGTAMVLVRAHRMNIPYDELIGLTLDAYGDKEAIRRYRLADITSKHDWDENYLDNILLARFCNIKFNDASLVQAARIGGQDPYMATFVEDYIWATLPQPFLDVFKINIDKKMLKGVSMGDYLYYRAGGPKEALGGFRTGSMAGTGMATFGWWYMVFLGVGMIPVFLLFDLLYYKRKVQNPLTGTIYMQATFSICGMLGLDAVFRYLPSESVASIAIFLIRDFIQAIILYLVIYHGTRMLNLLVRKRKPALVTSN